MKRVLFLLAFVCLLPARSALAAQATHYPFVGYEVDFAADPAGIINGFTKAFAVPGLGIVQWMQPGFNNSVRVLNPLTNTWTYLRTHSGDATAPSPRDNQHSFYVAALDELWIWGGSHAEPKLAHPTTQRTITAIANDGTGKIRVTTSAAHGYNTSDRYFIQGVTGTTEANGLFWQLTDLTATQFTLVGSTFTNAYISGGIVQQNGCNINNVTCPPVISGRLSLAACRPMPTTNCATWVALGYWTQDVPGQGLASPWAGVVKNHTVFDTPEATQLDPACDWSATANAGACFGGFQAQGAPTKNLLLIEPNTGASVCSGAGSGAEPYIACMVEQASGPTWPEPRKQIMGAMVAGDGNYLYLGPGLQNDGGSYEFAYTLWRYNLSTHAWTKLTDPPGTFGTGSQSPMISYDSDRGSIVMHNGTQLLEYSIANATWTDRTYSGMPGTAGQALCDGTFTYSPEAALHIWMGGARPCGVSSYYRVWGINLPGGFYIPPRMWVARPHPTVGTGHPCSASWGGCKQYNLLAMADGRFHLIGGDTNKQAANHPTDGFNASYYLDITNNSWSVAFPACSGNLQPKYPSETAFSYDPGRNKTYFTSGFFFDPPPNGACANSSAMAGPGMAFDHATGVWSSVPWSGLLAGLAGAVSPSPQGAVYDPVTDQVLSAALVSGEHSVARLRLSGPNANTWTRDQVVCAIGTLGNQDNCQPGHTKVNSGFDVVNNIWQAIDPVGRHYYWALRNNGGVDPAWVLRYNIDTQQTHILPALPEGQVDIDVNLAWDSVNRKLYHWSGNNTIASKFWIYTPNGNTGTWVEQPIVRAPNTDGTPGPRPKANSYAYNAAHNVYMLFGGLWDFAPGQSSCVNQPALCDSDPTFLNYYFLYRHGPALTSAPPPLPTVGFAASSSSGGEATTPALIPVTLSSAATVTVNYAVTGGTASGGGVDYTLASGQLSFSGGTLTQNISLALVNDNLPEPNETVQITLSSPSGAVLGLATHVFTIIDNDTFWASSGVGANAQAPGNDSNDCRSIATPCLTLDGVLTKFRAANGYAGANGVVNLRGGDYDSKGFKTGGGMTTLPSGTSWAAPFTIKAYDGDRTVRIIREDRNGPITKTVAEMQSATCTSPISGEINLDCLGAPTVLECTLRGVGSNYPYNCWNGGPHSQWLYLRLNRSGGDFHGTQNLSNAVIELYGLSEDNNNYVKYVVFDGLEFDGRGVALNIFQNTVSWAHKMWGQYIKFKNGAIRNSAGSCFAQPSVGDIDTGAGSPYGNTYAGLSWEHEAVWNGSAWVQGPRHKNNWIFEGTLANPYIIEKCGIPFNTYVVPGQTGGVTARDHDGAKFLHGWYAALGANECYYCEMRFAAGQGAGAEAEDNIIDKSYVHSNGQSGHYILGERTIITNSVFYNNGGAELHLKGSRQAVIKNNTFVAGPRNGAIGILMNDGAFDGNLIENNIFIGFTDPIQNFSCYYDKLNGDCDGLAYPVNIVRNNLAYKSGTTIPSIYKNMVSPIINPSISNNVLNQNPLLVNPPVDFSLQASSPAREVGFNNGLAVDRVGNTRPFGTGIDIGAYEYCTGGGCTAAPTTATITVVSSGASNVSISWTGGAGCSLTSPQATTFNIVCPLGTSITFNAPSNSGGANFSSWTGCTTSAGANCPVTNLTSGLTVTATYGALKSLTVSSTIVAAVPITVSPLDSSGAGDGTTTFLRAYATNTVVTLTAKGNVGNQYFNNWSGCDSVSGFGNVTCTVTMNADRAVTVNFGGSGCGVDKDNVTVGTRVTLCADTTVRDAPNGNAIGTQTTGAAGVVVGGPTEGGGVQWVQTDFDAGPDGHTTRRNLIPVVGAARVPGVTLKSGERRVIGTGKGLAVQ